MRSACLVAFACGIAFATLTTVVTLTTEARADESEAYRALAAPPAGYMRLVGTMELGKGLRFNNPYRLSTELGDGAKSLSLTQTYLDLGLAVAFGDPLGLEHGAALHWSLSTAGVPQQVLVPSYFAALPLGARGLVTGRLGPALILVQDFNVGGEAGLGAYWKLTARIGVGGQAVFDIFYGASTLEKKYTTYPILSGQLGVIIDEEWLP